MGISVRREARRIAVSRVTYARRKPVQKHVGSVALATWQDDLATLALTEDERVAAAEAIQRRLPEWERERGAEQVETAVRGVERAAERLLDAVSPRQDLAASRAREALGTAVTAARALVGDRST